MNRLFAVFALAVAVVIATDVYSDPRALACIDTSGHNGTPCASGTTLQ